MKVLIATPLYPPESGGPATYSKLLEDGLPPLGVSVVLVKFGDVKNKLFRHVRYFFNVLKAARGADIIYALDAVSVGYPALWAAKLMGKKFVVKIVGDYAWEQGKQRFGIKENLDEFVKLKNIPAKLERYRRIQTRVAMGAEKVIVPSHYLKTIVEAWGIPSDKIDVVWNAVAEESAGSVPTPVSQLQHPTIVSVGRLVPWKGMNNLIAATKFVREHGTQVSLAIIGDGPEREHLEMQAKETLKGGYYFSGALPHGDVLAAMNTADIFVLYSIYEGLSHVLIEALSSRAAIIASDIEGNKEVIENGKSGLLVPPGDPEALANAIQKLLSDNSLRTSLTEAASFRSKAFAKETMLQTTANYLRAV